MTTSPTPGRYSLRSAEETDWPSFLRVDSHAFGFSVSADAAEAERELMEPGRGLVALDGDSPAAIATAYSFDLTVPGGILPAAGVSWVGVLPTHRRRGLLRSMMIRQLHDVHDAGREPVAVLWASEPAIYGRFGYGLAAQSLDLSVRRGPGVLAADAPADPALRLRLVDPEAAVLRDAYDAALAARPGQLARDDRWWRRALSDLAERRDGRSELRCVVAEDSQGVRGYSLYATKSDWSQPGRPSGVVHVRELVSLDPAARAELYRYLFDQDLMAGTELWNVPLDDPLLLWLASARAAQPRLFDTLYVRLVDLAEALRRRTYSAPVDVLLEVRDELCPWNAGRWRLAVDDSGQATCQRPDVDAEPDLSLDVRELGAAYLGGTGLVELGAAGRVQEHTPGALARVGGAFRHSPAPWCAAVF